MRNPLLFLSVLIAISGCGGDEDIGEGQKSEAATAATCARACSRAAAAQCSRGNAECMAECKDAIESSSSACTRELDAFADCMTKARFTCDANGEAEAKECAPQLAAWSNCQLGTVNRDSGTPDVSGRDAGAPNSNGNDAGFPSAGDSGAPSLPASDGGAAQSDGGTPNLPGSDAGGNDGGNDSGTLGEALSCAPRADDDACSTCFKASCCDEIQACGAECVALLDCITECATEACVNTCYAAYPDGVASFTLLASCTEDSCETECSDEPAPISDAGVGPAPDLSQF